MKYIYMYLLVLYYINVVLCESNEVNDADLRKELRKHTQRVSETNYPCRIPQFRTFRLKELVPKDEWESIKHAQILPQLTVLHTCMGSGCCTGTNKTCLPKDKKQVPLIFGLLLGNKMKFKKVLATNHTSCHCQDSSTTT